MARCLLLLAALACLLRGGAAATEARAYVGQDAEGDLHVNASDGKRVLLGGVDIRGRMDALLTLTSTQAALLAETRADLAAARAEFSSIKPRTPQAPARAPQIYVTGNVGGSASVIVQRFDGISWAFAPNLTQPRGSHAMAVYNNFLYARTYALDRMVCVC
jgi:hypothetical protein